MPLRSAGRGRQRDHLQGVSRVRTVARIVVVLVTIGWLVGGWALPAASPPRPAAKSTVDWTGLKVTFLAIGQGEATLLQWSSGETALVDTGAAEARARLFALLEEAGVRRLDWLILSSDMPEAAGNAQAVLDAYPVEALVFPALTRQVVLPPRIPEGIRLVALTAGQRLHLNRGTILTALHPRPPLSLSPQNNALVFRLAYGDVRFLFTGSINAEAEAAILAANPDLRSAVLKVSDCGSAQGSHPDFLAAVDPEVAVVFSRGEEGDFGREEVLERLSDSWADIYQPSRHGSVVVITDGLQYQVVLDGLRAGQQELSLEKEKTR